MPEEGFDLEKLVSEGAIEALHLEPGNRYLILYDQQSLTRENARGIADILHKKFNIDVVIGPIAGNPRESFLAVQIKQESKLENE